MSDTSTAAPEAAEPADPAAPVEPELEADPALQPPPGYGQRNEAEPAPAEPDPEGWADPSSDPAADEQAVRDAAEAAYDNAEPGDALDPVEDAPEDEVDPTEPPKTPSNRGELEPQIKAVTDSYVTEELKLEDGRRLTPHRIATEIEQRRVDAGEKAEDVTVSAGAVTATLKRWKRYGFAVLSEGPLAFHEYTQDAMDLGLTRLKERSRAKAKELRAAAKVATVATTAVPDTDD